MYRQVARFVDGSVELKQMLESMLDKGYLSILDYYLIEVHYLKIKNEHGIPDPA
jgi:hypothetical protein